jgi:hypothetical protein
MHPVAQTGQQPQRTGLFARRASCAVGDFGHFRAGAGGAYGEDDAGFFWLDRGIVANASRRAKTPVAMELASPTQIQLFELSEPLFTTILAVFFCTSYRPKTLIGAARWCCLACWCRNRH